MLETVFVLLGCAVRKIWWLTVGFLAMTLLGACTTGAYLWQATTGHLQVLAASRNINEVVALPDTNDKLRRQLEYVQRIRDYSIRSLSLPDNKSYTAYAELNRPYVVWNVIAAPVDSLNLKTWCFPFTGCISYKGFYREADAIALGNQLRTEGLDVAVLGVPAYSTLGFTPDPVLSTFINYPVGELARLIFHELAHQVIYIADDTMFNESFATAVEELGVQAWLAQPGNEELRIQYETFDRRRVAFRAMLAKAQADLKTLYANRGELPDDDVLLAKNQRFKALRQEYELLKKSWGGWSGYDRFMAEDLNNAKLGVSGLYTFHVPAFKALFERCGSRYPVFYEAVQWLGEQPAEQRESMLGDLAAGRQVSGFSECS
jgi:predicted aminopeptidase